MQRKEDEIDIKHKDLEDLVNQHHRIVKMNGVEGARGQVEELRDVGK